jgi:putative DNA primase/helicase
MTRKPHTAQLTFRMVGAVRPNPRTVKEIVKAGDEDDSPLAEVLHDIAGEGRSINTRRLGWWLRRQAGRIVNGMKLTQDRVSRVADWKVLPAEE